MAITKDNRAFIAGKFAFELDSIRAGWLFKAEGGAAKAEVINEKLGPDHIVKKHIGGVEYEEITVSCGSGMSKGLYDWIKASFDHNYMRKNGAVVAANFNTEELSRLDFFNALISEIGFPALDAAAKDPCKISLKLKPEYTRYKAGGGGKISGGSYTVDQAKQKQWLTSNFRLRIDGTDCTRVNKVEALTIKQKNVANPVGEMRDYEQEPANLEIPNLVVTMPESHSKEFFDWHSRFVINGENSDSMEKGGTLEYLSSDLKTTLFTINFEHLGIFKISPDSVESGSDNIRRVKIEMYCENMSFAYSSSAVWS
ncbi:MAG: phage tail protein [Polyangia bacterium]